MKKKILVALLCVCLIPTLKVGALEYNYTEEQLKQGGGLENVLNNEKLDKQKEEMSREIMEDFSLNTKLSFEDLVEKFSKLPTTQSSAAPFATDVRSGFFYNYSMQPQRIYYWCGPASVQTSLNIINGSSKDQSVYASDMNTTEKEGTYVYQIVNELNKEQSQNSYGYREIGTDANRLWSPIFEDLVTHNVPTIARVVANNGLYLYYGAKEDVVHYVTIVGYMYYQTSGKELQLIYADNAQLNYGRGSTYGEHTDTLNNFLSATTHLIW